MDKLDASESLRKEEEQATETQPIVYGNALAHFASHAFHFQTNTSLDVAFPKKVLGNGDVLHVKSSPRGTCSKPLDKVQLKRVVGCEVQVSPAQTREPWLNISREAVGVLPAEFLSVLRSKGETVVSCRSAAADVDSRTQCRSSSTSTFWLWLHRTSLRAAAARLWVQHVSSSTSLFGASVFSY